jgi:hypothetical protein
VVERLEAVEVATGSKLAKTDAHRLYKRLDRSILSILLTNVVSSNNGIILSLPVRCPCPCSIAMRGQDINSRLDKFRALGACNSHAVKAYVGAGEVIIIYFVVAVKVVLVRAYR